MTNGHRVLLKRALELFTVLLVIVAVTYLLRGFVDDDTVAGAWGVVTSLLGTVSALLAYLSRLILGAHVAAGGLLARFVDTLPYLVARRKVWQWTTSFLWVSYGYIGRILLSERQLGGVYRVRGTLRKASVLLRDWWFGLSTWQKFAVAILLIVLQVAISPAAEYIVLFPVGFLIPLFWKGIRSVYGFIADLLFGALYRKYWGKRGRAIRRTVREAVTRRGIMAGIRLWQLRYRTMLRIWRSEYRKPSGRLEVSIIKSIHLIRSGRLDEYRGRGLLGNQRKRGNDNKL